MSSGAAESSEILRRAALGDAAAQEEMFRRHAPPLRRAIALRLDRRLAARVDPSDVLQETFLEAVRRLPEYSRQPDMPLWLWLRWLAQEKVLAVHRRHLGAEKRAVTREALRFSVDSSAAFVSGILGHAPTPSQSAVAAEIAGKLGEALGRLDDDERELILWRHFEQMSNSEAATLLDISPAAASKRYVRALERLRRILIDLGMSSTG